LTLLVPLADKDMDRTFTLHQNNMVSVRDWVERRPRHDLGHTAPVEDWRAASRPERAPGPKCVLRAALDAGRAALLAVGELVPPEEQSRRPVCGDWTWQDVLGHVADWEYHSVRALLDMDKGKRIEDNPDVEQWNAEHAAARRGESFSRAWADFLGARVELLLLLDEMDDERLAARANTAIEFLRYNYSWLSVCASHDFEHAGAFPITG
jgi:hypothetical protein